MFPPTHYIFDRVFHTSHQIYQALPETENSEIQREAEGLLRALGLGCDAVG